MHDRGRRQGAKEFLQYSKAVGPAPSAERTGHGEMRLACDMTDFARGREESVVPDWEQEAPREIMSGHR